MKKCDAGHAGTGATARGTAKHLFRIHYYFLPKVRTGYELQTPGNPGKGARESPLMKSLTV